MRKLINLFATLPSLIFALNTVNAQVQQAWVERYNGPNSNRDGVRAIATDGSGNIYVTGTRDENFTSNIHIIKYSPSGTILWEREPALDHGSNAKNMWVDVSGNVYVVGFYFITGENDCEWDPLVVKYNSSGTQQWVKTFDVGSGHYGAGQFVATDAFGNVYIAGVVSSNGDCTGHEGSFADYLVLKYDVSGNLQWSRTYNGAAPGNGFNNTHDLAVDGAGNVYVTGESQLNGQTDYATIKYSTIGTMQWIQRYDGPGNTTDFATGLALDASGNVYVTGGSTGTSSQFDIATVKYSSAGAQQWVQRFNGTPNLDDVPADIAVDGFGNSYITGRTGTNFSTFKTVTLKYNSAGAQQWLQTYDNNNVQNETRAIVLDGSINVYVTGMRWQQIEGTDLYRLGYLTIKYSSNGVEKWVQTFDGPHNQDEAIDIAVSGDNVYVTGESDGGAATGIDFATIKYTQCELHCPADITVNNDEGQCGAIVNYPDATTTGNCGSTITYSKASGTMFPVGITTVTVTSTETGATCSFNVTVVDNTPPVISCPSDKTINVDPGVCYASATSVNAGTATASENCSYNVVGNRSDGMALSQNYPVGNTTITWTATDASNNTTTCLQTITVVDNVPPTITGESASTYVLSPPNHTMRDVMVNYTATDNCAVTSVITVTSNEPINGVGDGDTDPDWIITDNHHVKLRAERSAGGNGRIYTVTITATDPSGNTAVKTIEVRVPHDIKNPNSGKAFIVGSTVPFEGEFWDKAGNSHSAKWMIDDNLSVKGIVTEPVGNKNGKVTGSYKFTAPGVYKLQMNVTDQNGITNYANTNGDLEAIVVIFYPNGGYTYGGGYYNSPAGALKSNPLSTGKASYGFAMNYFKNSTNPKGETQFEFKVGSFEFNALNFEYLVISNSMSQFKGTGKITGGQSGVGFTMTVIDGQLDGSGIDKIRMKIYNKNNGAVIYDNQPGASDAALPTQAVGANSTIVISGTNSSLTQSTTTQKAEMEATAPEVSRELQVIAYPNPSATNFSISVKANLVNEKISMEVVDMYGRIIETRNVNANSPIRFGDRYNPGTYFVRILQGKEHKELKLIKLSD